MVQKVDKKQLNSNIWKCYLVQVLCNAIFFFPIFVVFLQSNGLSLTKIFFLQTLFALGITIFEIPSGFFADVYGRKKSLILGSVLHTCGLLTYSFGTTFTHFCIAEFLWGVGIAFISGSDSALLYDSLIDLKKEKKYKQIEGKAFFFARMSSLISFILGGYLATFNLRYPFYVMIPIYLINIILVFTLKEPKAHKRIYKKNYLKKFKKIAKFCITNKEIRWLLIYFGIIDGFGCVLFWLIQPYLLGLNIEIKYFGIILAVIQLFTALTARYAFIIEEKLGKKISLISLGFCVSIPMILMGVYFGKPSLLFLAFLEFAWAFNFPVVRDYINKIVYSDKRATVLSIGSFFSKSIIAIFSPIAGYLGDIHSVQFSYIIMGSFSLVICIVCLINLKLDKVI